MASVGQLLQEVKLDDGQVRLQGSTGSIEYQLNNEGDEVVSGRTTRWVAFARPVPLSVSICLSVCPCLSVSISLSVSLCLSVVQPLCCWCNSIA